MTERPASPPTPDWSELQRKYWEAWAQVGQELLQALPPKSGENPWARALDHWGAMLAGSAPSESEDFVARLIEQGKSYFRLVEGVSRTLESAAAADQLVDWRQQFERALTDARQTLAESGPQAHELLPQMMAFWELPLDTWQRTASSLSVLPGDFLQHLKDSDRRPRAGAFEQGVERFLSIPGVGYTREWQDQAQVHARLLLEYQRAHQRYTAAFAQLGLRCIEHFEAKLKAIAAEGKTIDSMRALYDLWVDCCEEAYAHYVATEEYAELHAHLINSLMALKRQGSVMIDEALGAMNMPTQREVDALHERFQEMHREAKAMRADLQALREQLERLHERGGGESAADQKTRPAPRARKAKRVQAAPSANRSAARGG